MEYIAGAFLIIIICMIAWFCYYIGGIKPKF